MFIKYKNYTDQQIADLFIDSLAYQDEKAKQSAKDLEKEIISRFLNKNATYDFSEDEE